ncbi:MAG: TatD family hydrolase [Bacteroidia bacterium]
MSYIDIHTHVTAQKTDVISVQSLSLTDPISLVTPKNSLVSLGLHPWYATLAEFAAQLRDLTSLASQKNVKMIGECGLDKLRGDKMEVQIYILTQQILLAEKLGKPLILHCVRAFSELIALKKLLKVKVPMVVHGFNKNEKLGQQLLDNGFILSFGKEVLTNKSGAARLVRETNCFFLETDNSHIPIEEIYKQTAILKSCSVEEIKARILADWKKLIKDNV